MRVWGLEDLGFGDLGVRVGVWSLKCVGVGFIGLGCKLGFEVTRTKKRINSIS